jgi:hypothetical protein
MLGAPNNTIGQQTKPYKYQRVKFMYPSINYMGYLGVKRGNWTTTIPLLWQANYSIKDGLGLWSALEGENCSITLVGHTKI